MRRVGAAVLIVASLLATTGCRGVVVRYEEETTTYEEQGPSDAERHLRAVNSCRPYLYTPDYDLCVEALR